MENATQAARNAASACETGRGNLPSCGPLANPYVPYQQSDPNAYAPAKGLIRGTIFPGLDLPFMGMVNQKEKSSTLLHQIQTLAFAMTELGLYLDTHKEDQDAMDLFGKYRELYGELAAEYESKHGPLTQMEAGGNGGYDWTDDPWPWEFDAQEG